MNIVIAKLAKLKELGLNIHEDNRNYTTLTMKAEVYANEYFKYQNYVLGSVPAANENLSKVEYDICFESVENNYGALPTDYYHSLHELAERNDIGSFVEYLDGLHNQYKDEDDESVYGDMSGYVKDYLTDIENELDEIILAIGGTREDLMVEEPEDIGAIQHELAMEAQKNIRKEAPWIIGSIED